MSNPKQFLSIMVLAFFSIIVAGCSKETENQPNTQTDDAGHLNAISIATASTSGAWYPLGGAWANMIDKHVDGMTATAEVGAASIENIRKLNAGDVGLAFLQPDVAYKAYNGVKEFEGAKMGDVRSLLATYRTVTQIVTLKDYGIENLGDLKDKRIGVGAPGSGTEMTSKAVLSNQGLTYKDIKPKYLTFPVMINGIKDRQLDAAIGNMPIPTGIITDLSLQHDIQLVPIDGAERKKFLEENPFFIKAKIPADSYDGVKHDVETVAFRGVVYGTTQLTEKQAYEIVQSIWEHREEWKNVHAVTNDIKMETALEGIPTPLHIGAYKFYKEKGIHIPEKLIPPEVK